MQHYGHWIRSCSVWNPTILSYLISTRVPARPPSHTLLCGRLSDIFEPGSEKANQLP